MISDGGSVLLATASSSATMSQPASSRSDSSSMPAASSRRRSTAAVRPERSPRSISTTRRYSASNSSYVMLPVPVVGLVNLPRRVRRRGIGERAAGGAGVEVWEQAEVLDGGGGGGAEFAEQEVAGGFAEGAAGRADGGEGNHGEGCGDVVVRDDGQVFGDAEAQFHGAFDQAGAMFVRVYEHRAAAEGLALGEERVELADGARVVAAHR